MTGSRHPLAVIGRRAVIGGLVAGAALAQGTDPRGNAPRGDDPQAVIRTFLSALETTVRGGEARPFRQRFDQLAPAVDRSFDLTTILSVSVGARWASFAEGVRTELGGVFRTYTVASYVANFATFDGAAFEMEAETRASGADQVVRTRIVPRSGDSRRLDYVMRQAEAGWRVVDVLADGTISRVAVQRSDFRSLLGRDGNTAALLDSLRRKITELSGGALG